MFDRILDFLDPYIAEVIITLIGSYFGWIYRYVLVTKQSQESLHKAIHSGVDLSTDMLATMASAGVGGSDKQLGIIVDQVVAYTEKSVPDAVKYLAPSADQLRLLATAKVKRRLVKITGMFNK
jgi:hypothetical protein